MNDLRELAQAATPGPWFVKRYVAEDGEEIDTDYCAVGAEALDIDEGLALEVPEADAAYIAAASPDVILALLDRIATLEAALTVDNLDRLIGQHWVQSSSGYCGCGKWQQGDREPHVRHVAAALHAELTKEMP